MGVKANEAKSVPRFHYFVRDAVLGEKHIPIKIQVRDINTSAGRSEPTITLINSINNKRTGNDSPVAGA